jgi:hypothetical protein
VPFSPQLSVSLISFIRVYMTSNPPKPPPTTTTSTSSAGAARLIG